MIDSKWLRFIEYTIAGAKTLCREILCFYDFDGDIQWHSLHSRDVRACTTPAPADESGIADTGTGAHTLGIVIGWSARAGRQKQRDNADQQQMLALLDVHEKGNSLQLMAREPRTMYTIHSFRANGFAER